MYRWNMIKKIHSPNLVLIGSWWPEIWTHEYLISPIEISVNWPGSKELWTWPITRISMGLIRYSCGHISGHHEPIHVKFDVWKWKYWNAKKKIWWRHTSVLTVIVICSLTVRVSGNKSVCWMYPTSFDSTVNSSTGMPFKETVPLVFRSCKFLCASTLSKVDLPAPLCNEWINEWINE